MLRKPHHLNGQDSEGLMEVELIQLGDPGYSTPVMSKSGMVFRTISKLIML
ncbi:MAG: hypothetical protein KAS71_15085 [Bacteroidales bacterium]|nr:hypothetical protein [Bacteroidales bacterium]